MRNAARPVHLALKRALWLALQFVSPGRQQLWMFASGRKADIGPDAH